MMTIVIKKTQNSKIILLTALELYAQGLFCAVTFGPGGDVSRR